VTRAAWLAIALLAGGCDEMVSQPKASVYGRSDLFANGAAMQTAPPGAVPRDQAAFDAALANRPPMTLALITRGRERFDIYCEPCHGLAGDGQGIVPARGFPHPPDFREARLRAAPSRHVVDVISNGFGAMYAYGDRVPPADRWAIAAYIRALQLSDAAPVGALPDDERARLEADHGRD
jgi:mono/diheme cytochrome c family protein